jgi:4-hydroxy-tetrahydrodipicolinate synthase
MPKTWKRTRRNRAMPEWKGVISAIVTPLKKSGEMVDCEAIGAYCDFQVEKGIDGIFALGSTGEGPLLSMHERKTVAEALVHHVNHRVKVIIQTGCMTARDTTELTRHAFDIGADAAGIIVPYYYRLDEEAIFGHFARVADGVPGFPLFVYNIPEYTGNNVTATLFGRIVDRIETVVGVKTSHPDIIQVQGYVRAAGDRCAVFVGHDGLILAALSTGAVGIVSGNGSAFPEPLVEIYRAFVSGDLKRLKEGQAFVDRLRQVLGDGGIASFKTALRFRGIEVGHVREPHRDLSDPEATELGRALRELGVVD